MGVREDQSFPQFSKLPPELRDHIWSYTFPEPRVYEVLDVPCSALPQRTPSGRLMFADSRTEPPPAIGMVCCDARQAVLRRYRPLVLAGTLKYIDLSRDIIFLDSYLQVKRLLKVVRLLGQIELVRKTATNLALGTSWGFYSGLHLRLFHKSVRTQENMAKLLGHVAKFRRLKTIILVVYQQSVFRPRGKWPDRSSLHWQHHNLCQFYRANFNVKYDLENYLLRRPCQSRLALHDSSADRSNDVLLPGRPPKQYTHGPQPSLYQVRELRENFDYWIQKLLQDGTLGDLAPPGLETATLTWVYKEEMGTSCC